MLTQHQAPDTPVLPAVLLKHDPLDGTPPHYDWMLADPTLVLKPGNRAPTPEDRWLWTSRIAIPSIQWREKASFDVEPIQHHRWHFLSYEGELTGGRGSVARVDEGQFTVIKWEANLIEIRLAFHCVQGALRIAPINGAMWRATWV